MRVALLLFLALIVFVPAAQAGTYDVQLCADPAATGFAAFSEASALETSAICPQPQDNPDAGVYVGVKPGESGPAFGKSAGWTVTAPSGTTLTLTVHRRLRKSDASYEITAVTAENAVFDVCAAGAPCAEESRVPTSPE